MTAKDLAGFYPIFLRLDQDDGKGGLSLRGVAFMTVLAVLTVSVVLQSGLPSFRLSYAIQDKEATVTVLTVLAVSAVVAVSVVTVTPPLKLNPTFIFLRLDIENFL